MGRLWRAAPAIVALLLVPGAAALPALDLPALLGADAGPGGGHCHHAKRETPVAALSAATGGGGAPADLAATVLASPVAWGAAGVAGLGAWLAGRQGRALRLLAFLPLWTRLAPAALVRHPGRARLLDLVRANPGAPTARLVELAGMNEGTLLYHLRTLEKAQFVKSVRVGRDRVWYETGVARPDAGRLAALHAPTRQRLLDLVGRTPGLSKADLARALGLSKATVHHHLAALREAGLVEFRREKLRVRCYGA